MTPTVREGVLWRKELPDGREICVIPRAFNTILTIGHVDDSFGYDDQWCYETPGQAILAANEWNGTEEPEGWFRHAKSGRRRPNGNPEKEYIRV